MTRIALLESRSLLRISGADVIDFLQNLVTCDVEGLSVGDATFGALLTPQGKILFDFFLLRDASGFLLDTEHGARDALVKRLTFYKLRADVSIEVVDDLNVYAAWDGDVQIGFSDPRLAGLGNRIYAKEWEANSSENDWNAHRTQLGVPQSGSDFNLGDPFPHEVLMDQFSGAGVDFAKGCYVGQEVVSRMHHRGTARSRWVRVNAEADLPPKGTPILAGERTIGTMGGSSGFDGLATMRLDRAKLALDNSTPIEADRVALVVKIPEFVDFDWPE